MPKPVAAVRSHGIDPSRWEINSSMPLSEASRKRIKRGRRVHVWSDPRQVQSTSLTDKIARRIDDPPVLQSLLGHQSEVTKETLAAAMIATGEHAQDADDLREILLSLGALD